MPELGRWVQEYRVCFDADASSFKEKTPVSVVSESECSAGSISRSMSRENLYIDPYKEPDCPLSYKFLKGLREHESQMPGALATIKESVGLSKVSIGRGSLWSSVFTLVASAMGAGCLSLPHMLKKSGLVLGLLLLIIGAILAHLSLVTLMSCARYMESRSFAELVALCGPSPSNPKKRVQSHLVVDVVIALYGVAAVLIYMMLIGDFFLGIVQAPVFGAVNISRGQLIVGSLLVVFPLSLPLDLSALRHICILSTGAIIFMALVVAAKAPLLISAREAAGEAQGIQFFVSDVASALQSFGIAVFAFAAHTNAVSTVNSLENPAPLNIWNISLVSVGIEVVFYILIALGGYLSFGQSTQQDFIRNYGVDDLVMLVVRCVYAFPVLFGVPINLSPAAASLQSLVRRGLRSRCDLHRWCTQQTLHTIIVAAVLGACVVVAVLNDALADVIGIFGSLFGTLICLWWPLTIYRRTLSQLHTKAVATMLVSILSAATLFGVLAFLTQAKALFGIVLWH